MDKKKLFQHITGPKKETKLFGHLGPGLNNKAMLQDKDTFIQSASSSNGASGGASKVKKEQMAQKKAAPKLKDFLNQGSEAMTDISKVNDPKVEQPVLEQCQAKADEVKTRQSDRSAILSHVQSASFQAIHKVPPGRLKFIGTMVGFLAISAVVALTIQSGNHNQHSRVVQAMSDLESKVVQLQNTRQASTVVSIQKQVPVVKTQAKVTKMAQIKKPPVMVTPQAKVTKVAEIKKPPAMVTSQAKVTKVAEIKKPPVMVTPKPVVKPQFQVGNMEHQQPKVIAEPVVMPLIPDIKQMAAADVMTPFAIEQVVDQAYDMSVLGKPGQAFDLIRHATASVHLKIDMTHRLVNLLIDNQRLLEADIIVDAARRYHADSPVLAMDKAQILMRDQNHEGALAVLESIQPKLDEHPDYYGLIAYNYMTLKKYQWAQHYYQSLAHADANNPRWWFGLGVAYKGLDRNELAKEAFQRAMQQAKSQPKYRLIIADELQSISSDYLSQG